MARPRKEVVDYFPHTTTHGKTLFILEQRYRNDGYALWFKILELLGSTEGHALDLRKEADLTFLSAKAFLTEEKTLEIIDLMASLGAIDEELWKNQKTIWSDNFIDGIRDVYRKRAAETPVKPAIRERKPAKATEQDVENPQSKVNKSKVDKSREKKHLSSKPDESAKAKEIIKFLNKLSNRSFKTDTDAHLKLIKARFNEGYTEQDLKGVIATKNREWNRTPARGEKDMRRFLRPSTLFNKTNFENYHQEFLFQAQQHEAENAEFWKDKGLKL